MTRSEVLEKLKTGFVNIMFEKVNGEQREMFATLDANLINLKQDESTEKRKKTPNPDIQPVFDMDKKQWRSFRWDRLKVVNGLEYAEN